MSDDKKNVTVLGRETEFNGTIEFTDNLIITGKFNGTIKAAGDLEVDKTAICQVDSINANSVIVFGKVTGNILAEERIEICSGSSVKGDLKSARLRIADNVDFEGQVEMLDAVSDVDLFSIASKEFKESLLMKSDIPQ
ncbi:MAG: polymer-forming cytoskeletal protein [Treponema sp.]|nr:polymer-forming cytoskeletal protein [Treponema sp.]